MANHRSPEREAAIAAGEKFYFPDEPCLRGHSGGRCVKTRHCLGCDREKHRRLTKSQQEKKRARDHARYDAVPISIRRLRGRIAAERQRRRAGELTIVEYRAKIAADAAARKAARQAEIAERRASKRHNTLARQAATKDARAARQREKSKAWREANRDRFLELQKEWRERNIEKRRAAKRSRKTAKRVTLVRELTKLQRGRCAYCCVKLGSDFHVDHIMPLKLGGPDERSNLQLACGPCNLSKSAKHPVAYAQSLGRLI